MQAELLLRLSRATLMALALVGVALVVPAVQAAGEATPVVDDPVLEARVMDLSYKLRCLVCQNESIAESRAPLALDLRNQVREQFAAGKSEKEVIDFLVARYGDFVLYTPPFKATTVLLWIGPGLLLIAGAGWLLLRLRIRAREQGPHLTDAERARARALLEGAPADSEEQHS